MTSVMPSLDKQELEKKYLGKRVHVIYNENQMEIDRWGTVLKVEPTGKLVGSWGDHKIILGQDYISLED